MTKKLNVGFKRLSTDAIIPTKAHANDSGFDLYASEDVVIEPGETKLVPTEIAVDLPEGCEAQVRPKSGITSKTKLRVQLGTVDNGYTGEVKVIVDNINSNIIVESVRKGDKIAQLVVQYLPQVTAVEVDEIDGGSTSRGEGGFGSTGVRHEKEDGQMTEANMKVYLAGDILKRGSQLLREQERNQLTQIPGISVHNPADDEEINDKSRAPRAEDIFRKDTEAILESDVVIFDADDDSVGTTTEIGQVWGVNYMHERLIDELFNSDGTDADFGKRVRTLLRDMPYKEVYWQCTDVRNVPNATEWGLRRSYSLNQYLYGCLLDLAGDSSTFDEIVAEINMAVGEEVSE